MMLTPDRLLLLCIAYVAGLFLIAWIADRRAAQGKMRWLASPVVYTLSISVYCTSWTFYGAVGSAARSGLEFATIYLGPTLVFVGWFWLLRRMVRLGRVHRITSIADMISSRFGKSPALAALVTLIAVVGTTPYIALQLQSIALSYATIVGDSNHTRTAFWVAAGMAAFTILFGTRSIDANERHSGVVAAIALEALVKLAALVAVGLFVVFWVMGGVGETFAAMPERLTDPGAIFGPRWAALTFLAAAAVLVLPRMFQVIVVENVDERHLATASWLFPLYLFLMSLFVLPIAAAGLTGLPAEANPDMFMITVPASVGRDDLVLLAFIGGFSSATSMVIVAAIALSTMLSNQVVMPLAVRYLRGARAASGDVRDLLLVSRRIAIGAVFLLGFLYHELTGGSDALAAIGLIAFAGLAQVLPALLGGMFWKGATRAGAMAGMVAGTLLWLYTLFLPSFEGDFLLSEAVLRDGPFGIAALRPEAMLGLAGMDPLVHALVWSLGLNTGLFLLVSLWTRPSALERLQAAVFVDVFRAGPAETGGAVIRRTAAAEDLFVLAQRILGVEAARRLFAQMAIEQGITRGLPRPTEAVIGRLERELAGSIGAASAHAMISSATGTAHVSLTELMEMADETQRLMATSARLADKTAELERTAAELREVNTRLRALDAQKDDFLSQVSHELRTPMTSIRSFSEILLDEEIDRAQTTRFVRIIHEESLRLTRLLDEILDINRLESGSAEMPVEPVDAEAAVLAALDTLRPVAAKAGVEIVPHRPVQGQVLANPDRLRQVLINLVSNAIKYNGAPEPRVEIAWAIDGPALCIDVIDNGGGVSRDEAERIFSKFVRGDRSGAAQGAGLGLPISRAAIRRMGGDLSVVFAPDQTSFFRLRLPRLGASCGPGSEPAETVADPATAAAEGPVDAAPSGSDPRPTEAGETLCDGPAPETDGAGREAAGHPEDADTAADRAARA